MHKQLLDRMDAQERIEHGGRRPFKIIAAALWNRTAWGSLRRGRPAMPLTLKTMLCETRDALNKLRRDISDRGYINDLHDIDALLGLAQEDAVRQINKMDRETPPT